ncbi:MAG: cysteine desulfurase [Thermoprotei archaeon]|nr:MAG: cysteine desulfurase [Thermoprotei archaeon]
MSHVRELLSKHGKPPREVYFDHENSGWVPPEVVEAMLPFFNIRGYGHPAITNLPGWEAYEVVETTRELVMKVISARQGDDVVFTHSGTEANNLAIMGTALANKKRGTKIVISSIEHPSVIYPAQELEELGFRVVMVPVDGEGFIDPEILNAMVDKETILVSTQMVNHEIGTIQELRELVKAAKDANPEVIFHTDAIDALGRIPIDVSKLGVDLLSLSSHKIHGPKGVGALYVREGVKLKPIIHGALSTQKLWPGVENVPALAGFRKAIELAFENFEANVAHMRQLRDKLLNGILERVDDVLVNGPIGDRRAPDNVNVSFLYIEGESLTVELSLRGVYVSSGSACTSRILEPSHVLLAIGRKHEEAHGSIMFRISRYHKEEDIDYALSQIPEAVERLRALSPIAPKRKAQ